VQVFLDLGLVRLVEKLAEEHQSLVKHEPIPLELLVPQERTPGFSDKVELIHKNHSALSEQFRSLKVRLTNQVDPPIHSLCITSPIPEDGKSLICTNLALSFSREMGRRVLLLECDLRNPTVSEKLGIPLDPGLYQYLLEGLEPQCCMRKVDNLYVMTAGEVADDAIELLSLARMKELMRFLRQEFDTVIVDAPPILPVADARLISTLTDATVMVIYQGRTPYSSIEKAIEVCDKKKMLGVILNGVKSTGLDGYYSYGHYYAYPYSRKQKEGKTIIEMRKRSKKGHSSSANIIFK
jgi:capsular exopolysaccharide synthesis family protein